jgi:hypothetical protein
MSLLLNLFISRISIFWMSWACCFFHGPCAYARVSVCMFTAPVMSVKRCAWTFLPTPHWCIEYASSLCTSCACVCIMHVCMHAHTHAVDQSALIICVGFCAPACALVCVSMYVSVCVVVVCARAMYISAYSCSVCMCVCVWSLRTWSASLIYISRYIHAFSVFCMHIYAQWSISETKNLMQQRQRTQCNRDKELNATETKNSMQQRQRT